MFSLECLVILSIVLCLLYIDRYSDTNLVNIMKIIRFVSKDENLKIMFIILIVCLCIWYIYFYKNE